MVSPLKNRLEYFTGSRLLTALTGNEGPYAENVVPITGKVQDRPFVKPDLSIIASVASGSASAQVEFSIGARKRKARFEGNRTWDAEWSIEIL
jgi:hypothetical protein